MFARKLSSSPHSRGTVTVGAWLARDKAGRDRPDICGAFIAGKRAPTEVWRFYSVNVNLLIKAPGSWLEAVWR
jgi:hypothetical protein